MTARIVLRKIRIGYVMQDSGLMPHRTVLDNICTVPRLNKVPKAQCRERAFELMDDLGLDRALAKRYPRELSGGQAQRVGIARALADDPAIMIMDEPFSAIDPLVRRDLQNQVLDLKRRLNKTIVMVTHDIEEAFLLGDQIVLLGQRGRIEQAGTAEELITQPANDFVADFVGVQDRVVSVQRRDGRDVIVDRHGRVTAFVQGDACYECKHRTVALPGASTVAACGAVMAAGAGICAGSGAIGLVGCAECVAA